MRLFLTGACQCGACSCLSLKAPHATGRGATASGASAGTDWTQSIQSSCYQHGDNHNKAFSEVAGDGGGRPIDLSQSFHWYEIDWRPESVTIR